MNRKVYAVFVAGGSGSRMGGEVPKQFLEVKGKTLLQHTMEKFIEAIPDVRLVTVLPKSHFDDWKTICVNSALDVPQILVEGGITRFHSVRNALGKVPDGAYVIVHDGVRPFVSIELIRSMLAEMEHCHALIPVVPVTDTLRSKDPEYPDPDRSKCVAVQTPQIFRSEELKAAYSQAYDPLFTDDASVAARAGIPVSLFPGEKYNIKITTPEDLVIAKFLL